MRTRRRLDNLGRRVAGVAGGGPPYPVSARAFAGTTLRVTWDQDVSGFGLGDAGFALTASGGAVTLEVGPGGGTTTDFTTSRSISAGETLTLAYTPGAASGAGGPLAAFSGFPVVNQN